MSLGGLLTLMVLWSGLLLAFGRGRLLNLRIKGAALASAPIHYGILAASISFGATIILIIAWMLISEQFFYTNTINQLLVNAQNLNLDLSPEKIALIADQITSGNAKVILHNQFFTHLQDQYLNHREISFRLMSWSAMILMSLLGAICIAFIKPSDNAQKANEKIASGIMFACGMVAIVITIGVFLSLISETLRFFELVSPIDFLFGLEWSPQTALRPGQIAAQGSFGMIPLFTGTLMITLIAVLIAGPLGLFSAIYMTEYANTKIHAMAKPVLEILAGIPTVVYGFFAALTLAPFIRNLAESLGLAASSESALAAGIVIGIMIIPFISSLSDDVISAVPDNLREGSFALGATQSETIIKVVLPAALPGIASAFLLAISRAIGETMIVVMAAGLAARLTANPLEAVTTVTVQIVTLLVGDQEFDSPKTLAAFALGLTLFIITLILNTIALITVRKYGERYE